MRCICRRCLYSRSDITFPRLWGPSSNHAGGIVNHVFCDGHVDGLSDSMDPNVYLWLVTETAVSRQTISDGNAGSLLIFDVMNNRRREFRLARRFFAQW